MSANKSAKVRCSGGKRKSTRGSHGIHSSKGRSSPRSPKTQSHHDGY